VSADLSIVATFKGAVLTRLSYSTVRNWATPPAGKVLSSTAALVVCIRLKQVYVAARYGEVFGTRDGGESWLEMPLPQGVQHIYALACG
jgi:hypothetical protein